MTIHELKSWPDNYQPILEGKKRFEIRKNDRNFREGDILHLREWNPRGWECVAYTGRHLYATVDYCMTEFPFLPGAKGGIMDSIAVMSITVKEIGK